MTYPIKPKRLQPGDTLTAISLSWGGARMPASVDAIQRTLKFLEGAVSE